MSLPDGALTPCLLKPTKEAVRPRLQHWRCIHLHSNCSLQAEVGIRSLEVRRVEASGPACRHHDLSRHQQAGPPFESSAPMQPAPCSQQVSAWLLEVHSCDHTPGKALLNHLQCKLRMKLVSMAGSCSRAGACGASEDVSPGASQTAAQCQGDSRLCRAARSGGQQ